MSTFATTRIAANLPATGVHFDSFNQRLLLVGAGTAGQRDPANPSLEISSRNDATTGENYLSFTPTGRGHAIATRYGNEARLIFIDYSATGLIGDPSTLFYSLPIPGVSDLSGQAALDGGLLMRDGFE